MTDLEPFRMLRDMFPHKSQELIENIIRLVEENSNSFSSSDEKLEAMINLLVETGKKDAPTVASNDVYDEAASPDNAVTVTMGKLVEMIPDANPAYLECHALELAYDDKKLEEFINEHMDKKDYPKLEDYLRMKNEQQETDKYLSGFKLYRFLLEFPDPRAHFNDAQRKHAFVDFEKTGDPFEEEFVLKCLYNEFLFLRESDIRKVFKMNNRNVIRTYNKLRTIPPAFKIPRGATLLPDIPIKNKVLLQEVAFIQHEKEIKKREEEKERDRIRAKEWGLLENCGCCYTDDIIPEDCFICRNGCKFCRECIRKGAEIAYSEGKTEFACLANCGSDFSLATLQMVLNPTTFANFCHNIQMQEINKADIPGLELCPLCSDFAMIPDANDQIFHCDKCNKDSCRKCKHEAHVPLRCNEIEYDEDVKIRTHIENRMTLALIRKCNKCKTNIVKDSGCNKITCSVCGTKMCYVCRATINDYTHFNTGCPLHTDDRELHFQNVMQGANSAKVELGVDRNPALLKFDPTRNFNK